jgi:hypothetical protein
MYPTIRENEYFSWFLQINKTLRGWVQWCIPIIPMLGRLRKED